MAHHPTGQTQSASGLFSFCRDGPAVGLALEPAFVDELKAYDLLYDEDADGGFVHFYTRTLGTVFFEFVERRGTYDGYGAAADAPVRLAAQSNPLSSR